MAQISKKDYSDFPDFSKNLVSGSNIMEAELAEAAIQRSP